jgi:hypothetical protein
MASDASRRSLLASRPILGSTLLVGSVHTARHARPPANGGSSSPGRSDRGVRCPR